MTNEFWDRVPNDETIETIKQLPSFLQRTYFLSVAERCRAYNAENDTFYTFREFMEMYPDGSGSSRKYLDSDEH